MKNFQYMGKINPDTLIAINHQIFQNPDLWDENTLRTKHPGTAHSEVSDIWLWFNQLPKEGETKKVINDKVVVPYRGWDVLTALRNPIFGLMHQVQAVRLGRVIVTKLPAGKQIDPHTDGGAPATFFKRYQIAIQCLPGNIFQIENEQVGFESGDVWAINNRAEHSVVNNSQDDRIVCIVDLRLG